MNLNTRSWDWHDGKTGKEHDIAFGTLTPTNEWFIWEELCLDHATHTTDMIVMKIVEKSGMLKFRINLIDPLANKIQSNVNTTVVFDINRQLSKLKREGMCSGGVFESADTKSTLGREEMKKRLYNSIKFEKPYNNCVEKDGVFTYLPTMWINRYKCPNTWKSVQKWATDVKGNPEQKHSHFPTSLEFIAKDIRFKPRMDLATFERKSPYASYFHVR